MRTVRPLPSFNNPITMNKKTKTKTTYGVYNLIEWYARLRMGKAIIKVAFTGGSITTQGVTPATFTTENPTVQFAIESSPEFTSGKIKVVRRVKLGGEIEYERNPPKVEAPAEPPADAEVKEDKRVTEKSTTATVAVVNEDNSVSEVAVSEVWPQTELAEDEAQKDEAPGLTPVEFACNDDARDYLVDKFSCGRSKLRTRADMIAAGKACGVDIIFVDN